MREVVAQIQDMLTAHGHLSAHFCGHSWGTIVSGWAMKASPQSVSGVTLMEPALFVVTQFDHLPKILLSRPHTCLDSIVNFTTMKELFTQNLIVRNFFWEQSVVWPEDIDTPATIQLAASDALIPST